MKSISASLDSRVFPEIRQVKLLYRGNVANVEEAATAVGGIGVVAVLLAAAGIIGLVAFTISQRTRELAIRIALGARPARILADVLGQFSWPVTIGMLAGTAAAAAGSKLLRVALYGISNLDFASYAGALGLLVAVVGLSTLLPARRTLHLDLSSILHYE